MVAFRDGSILAQLGVPDMKTAIAYALSYPERLPLDQPLPQFDAASSLTFEKPDTSRFPCLALAYRAARTGGTLPAVMNAANEMVVDAFLRRRIPFTKIADIIAQVMDRHESIAPPSQEAVLAADRWAREAAAGLIGDASSV
jgi:1-deoxy-D-xylulose-5-phosphate reductoisomerase